MESVVGVLEVTVYCPGSFSLKDKRSITRGLIETLRNEHNASVSTVAHEDHQRLLTLGMSFVGTNQRGVKQLLRSLEQQVESNPETVIRETSLTIT